MRSSEPTLLHDVELSGQRLDCRLRDGRVVEIGDLFSAPSEVVIDARGGALLPGLVDHHIHLHAYAAESRSIHLGTRSLAQVAAEHPGTAGREILRVVGASQELTRRDLDTAWPDRPVRVRHRSGAVWTLNTPALNLLTGTVTPAERETGQFWRATDRLHRLLPDSHEASLSAVSRELASYGVTHVTDATPGDGRTFTGAVQHVMSLATDGTGPVKLVLPDHTYLDIDLVVAKIQKAHALGRGVAIHAITSTSLAVAIAALSAAGVNEADRIEHAAVCDDAAAARLANLGVVVITQPTIFTRRGTALRRESADGERDLLWRLNSLREAGVRISLSSDAPHGDPNPWETIRAAATRAPAPGEATLGPEAERMAADVALASLLSAPDDPAGRQRRIVVGAPADLVLLDVPLRHALDRAAATGRNAVRATFIGGHVVHDMSAQVVEN